MSRRDEVLAAIGRSAAITPGERVLALLSGGADSVCLLHALHEAPAPTWVEALHVNHGLRPAADEDERFCADLARSLGIHLEIERVAVPSSGNREAEARQARYEAAERVRVRRGLDVVATGHTASDQVETILFRLASSPGRRALLGMRPRRDRIVRPLLEVTHEQAQAYCVEAGLEWREDESNRDLTLARNRLRHEILPGLRRVHPAADRNILATAALLRDEHEVLEQAVDEALREAGAGGDPPAVELARLGSLPRPLVRLVLRRLAEDAAGAAVPLGTPEIEALERLAAVGGSGSVTLPGGVEAVCEYGIVRFQRPRAAAVSEPARLAVPGRCRFGGWELRCAVESLAPGAADLGSLDAPVLDAALLAPTLTVRGWSDGDRIAPLGLAGTKSLQDLFVDRKVPRSVRGLLPVVESAGEIAWVAGVAVSDTFKVTDRTTEVARLEARAGAPAEDESLPDGTLDSGS
jgi:tRNA(Ile)-lysidine synthase